jgi:hypothetical protein
MIPVDDTVDQVPLAYRHLEPGAWSLEPGVEKKMIMPSRLCQAIVWSTGTSTYNTSPTSPACEAGHAPELSPLEA